MTRIDERVMRPSDAPVAAGEPARLDWLKRYASWLDDVVRVPGTRFRFGLDAIFGLVPGLGDVVGAVFAVAIVAEGVRQRVPRRVLLRMILNVAIDTGFGSVPVVGDLFDAVWKANRRNLGLLEHHVEGRSTVKPVSRVPVLLAAGALLLLLLLLAAGGVWLAAWLIRAVFVT
jgi:hypothetical protein